MRTLTKVAGLTGLTSLAMFAALPAMAQEHIGPTEQQSTNWTAIGMFGSFDKGYGDVPPPAAE